MAAIVVHNTGSNFATMTSGTQVTNCALVIRGVPERYLVFSFAMRSNTGSINAGSVFWQPAGTATGQEELTFLGALNHSTQALRVEQWGLLAPSASTATTSRVVFTTNASVRAVYSATCWQGVHQTTPYAGYPSVPTNFASGQGATLTSPVGETTAISVTTDVGDHVVDMFGSDMAISTNNFNTFSDHMVAARHTSSGGTSSAWIRCGTSYEVATGASTSMKWKSFGGTSSTYNTGQSGRSYVHCAFPLKPSPSVAPYWVMPPNEIFAIGGTSSGLKFNNILDWPTAGSMAVSQAVGPLENAQTINLLAKQFTAHTQVGITAAATYAGSVVVPDVAIYKMVAGDGQSQLGTGTIILYLPAAALADDVVIINVYSEGATVSAATFASAGSPTADQIATQAVGGMRQTLLYKRLTAADVTASSITITFSATPGWRSAIANIYRGCITSRTPYVNSTDDAGSSALPTAATGTTADPTVTGVTTTSADMTVVMAAGKFNGSTYWAPPLGGCAERDEFYNVWMGDLVMPTAGATGNQALVTTDKSGEWATMAITLIPSAVGTLHTKTLAQDGRVYSNDAVTRFTELTRTGSQTGRVYSNDVLTKLGSYKRAPAQSGRVYSNDAVTRSKGSRRTITETAFGAEAQMSLARLVAFNRTPTQTRGFISAIVNAVPGGVTAFARTLLQTGRVYSNDSVSRIVTLTRTAAQTGRAYSNDTVAKVLRLKRALTQSGRVYSNDAVVKQANYKRSLTHTRPTGFQIVLTPGFTGAIISFYDYGSPNQPVYQKIDDLSATFPGVSFYFEAQLKSNTNSASYAELYDVTAAAAVAGSQVVTTSPHTTSQILRSGPINLVSGHVYKARIGHATGVTTEPSACRIIARDVA